MRTPVSRGPDNLFLQCVTVRKVSSPRSSWPWSASAEFSNRKERTTVVAPIGEDEDPVSHEDRSDAQEDHGQHEQDPHELEPRRLSDHSLAAITAFGTLVLILITLLKL
jgi:hypothetical protein